MFRSRMIMTQRARVPIAFRSTATTSGSATVTKPAGVATGDLVVVILPDCSTGVTLTTTSGSAWNRTELTWWYNSVLFWKVLTGTDVSNTWGLSESNGAVATAWQPGTSAVASVYVTFAFNALSAGASTLTIPGVTTNDATKGVISIVVDRDTEVTPGTPTGFTSRVSTAVETYLKTAVADHVDYQGGDVVWTGLNGISTYAECGFLLHVVG